MTWIPTQIKALRHKLGLTQQEFADRLGHERVAVGATKTAVYRWEAGQRQPSLRHQQALDQISRRDEGKKAAI